MAAQQDDLIRDETAQPLPGPVLVWCPVLPCTWGVAAPDEETGKAQYYEHVIDMTDFARKVTPQ